MLSGTRLLLAAGLLGYAVLLYIQIGAVAGGSDNSGYFNEARLFSRGRIFAPIRTLNGLSASEVPFLYIPLGFKPAPDGTDRMAPTYPPGLPLLLVPASWIAGWGHAGDLVLLIHSLAGLALTYALGRVCGLPPPWALVGSAVLAASPLYLYVSLQALSDVPATVWATAAVVAACRSREKTGWALASGACISLGFLIRPNNFLIVAPVLIAVGLSPQRILLVALGSLPGIGTWLAINHVAYGRALESGYGAIGNEFHTGLILPTLWFYVRWLPVLLSPIVVCAAAFPAFFRSKPRVVAVLASWVLAYVAFFSPYRWTHEQWWYLRYVLPAAPALIVAGLMALYLGYERTKGKGRGSVPWERAVAVLLLIAAIGVELSQTNRFRIALAIGHGERKYGRVADWLKAHVPENSVLVVSQSSGALYYFTDFTLLRFEEMNSAVSERVRSSIQSEVRPLYAVLFPFERDTLVKIPGTWTRVGSVGDVTVWHCDL